MTNVMVVAGALNVDAIIYTRCPENNLDAPRGATSRSRLIPTRGVAELLNGFNTLCIRTTLVYVLRWGIFNRWESFLLRRLAEPS